jgi:hypothetical protein
MAYVEVVLSQLVVDIIDSEFGAVGFTNDTNVSGEQTRTAQQQLTSIGALAKVVVAEPFLVYLL